MQRPFITQKSPWLAVKAHYKGTFPNDAVGLYNFKGGYCGVSKVENDVVNICYLADYETFKNYKNIEQYQEEVVTKNPNLKAILNNMTLLFEKPLTISQISFAEKEAVENHILMIGDTAGLIHPLCGNGMAMAIHSAKIASELTAIYLENQMSREALEKKYTYEWNLNFKQRLKTGRRLASLLQKPKLSETLLRILIVFPFLLPKIINKTHGQPLTIN
jgi:flavin-dependent dehydrogenase